jgi:hypothetical protein
VDEANRRRAERIPVRLPARYQALGDDAEVSRSGTIGNISTSGLMLVADETLTYGTRVQISFFDDQGGAHTVLSMVVRSQGMGESGVAFVELSDATLEYVQSFSEKK